MMNLIVKHQAYNKRPVFEYNGIDSIANMMEVKPKRLAFDLIWFILYCLVSRNIITPKELADFFGGYTYGDFEVIVEKG